MVIRFRKDIDSDFTDACIFELGNRVMTSVWLNSLCISDTETLSYYNYVLKEG